MVKDMWIYIVFAPGAADELIELAIIIERLMSNTFKIYLIVNEHPLIMTKFLHIYCPIYYTFQFTEYMVYFSLIILQIKYGVIECNYL